MQTFIVNHVTGRVTAARGLPHVDVYSVEADGLEGAERALSEALGVPRRSCTARAFHPGITRIGCLTGPDTLIRCDGLTSQPASDVGVKPGCPPSVDPSVYVVPVPGGFAVLPFKEDVGRHLSPYAGPALTAAEVIGMVRTTDLSLMCDASGGSVLWLHGRDLTADLLALAHVERIGG